MGAIQKIVANWVKKGMDVSGETVTTASGNFFIELMGNLFKGVNWGEFTESELINLFHNTAEVFAPINHRASRVAQAKWVVKKLSDNSIVTDNKEINRLITHPNPFQNWQELIYEMCVYQDVTGNNFLYANCPDTLQMNYRNISTLQNLAADLVTIQTQGILKLLSATNISDVIRYYNVANGNGVVNITPDKILHTKNASLKTYDYRLRGMSPLKSASKNITNLKLVYSARKNVYETGGALGMLVSEKSDATGKRPLNPDEKKALYNDYYDRHGLKDGQRPIGITASPVRYEKIGANIAELMPFEETEADAASIFSVYKVPRELMPSRQPATYDNQNAAEKGLFNNTVIPWAHSIAKSLTTFLKLDENGFYLEPIFDHIAILQENAKEKADVEWRNNETNRVKFSNGIITLNDWRRNSKMEPVKNGMYDKLLYDMTPEELVTVETIIKLSKGASHQSGAGNTDVTNTQQ